ncbi:uncharacterized protein EV420DRAFT_1502305 [Desarmillaria tabescens]|uniref:Uncharacterized protein n=1 Tax=Armillaria tabescens TaxID=1929756 RepID=A0AA39NLS8_ARMTA|nr:uncharacterized protein EV420DRAFT_1502305 [Desarmillaria tabescens]KAK0468001.1 hypothetical protein EV420DRAFT_1502305 [Desarmillaria tabescens]
MCAIQSPKPHHKSTLCYTLCNFSTDSTLFDTHQDLDIISWTTSSMADIKEKLRQEGSFQILPRQENRGFRANFEESQETHIDARLVEFPFDPTPHITISKFVGGNVHISVMGANSNLLLLLKVIGFIARGKSKEARRKARADLKDIGHLASDIVVTHHGNTDSLINETMVTPEMWGVFLARYVENQLPWRGCKRVNRNTTTYSFSLVEKQHSHSLYV